MGTLNRINFETKSFKSGGKNYYIMDDQFGYQRLAKFLDMLPVIALGKTELDNISFLQTLFNRLTSGGDDFKKSYFEASNMLFNYLEQSKEVTNSDYLNRNIDYYLEFCTTFCCTKSEDLSKFDKALSKEKVDTWKKDMNILDFFFLAKKQVPKLQELLIKLGQDEK